MDSRKIIYRCRFSAGLGIPDIIEVEICIFYDEKVVLNVVYSYMALHALEGSIENPWPGALHGNRWLHVC